MISDFGDVVGRVVTTGRYKSFSYHKTIYVHRAVYELFVGQIPEGYQINHIDGNKHNNHVSNLEAVTRSENQKHAHRIGIGGQKSRPGSTNPMFKGWVTKIPSYGKLWHAAKRRGMDWKSMSKEDRLALLGEMYPGAELIIIK